MSLVERDEATDSQAKQVTEELALLKEAMSHVLREKAVEMGGNSGAFYYLVGSLLSNMTVKYIPDPRLVLATDGKHLFVGPAYAALKKKYEARDPKAWSRLRYALVLHEVVHVLYGHPHRIKLVDDPELYNIVADLLVNTVVERRLNVGIPPDFVTMESFPKFIEEKTGIKLTKEKADAIRNTADLFLRGEITTEDAYRIFASLEPEVISAVKNQFRGGYFFGHDLADESGQRFAPPVTGKEEVTKQAPKKGIGKTPEETGGEKGGEKAREKSEGQAGSKEGKEKEQEVELRPGELAEEGKEVEEMLREVRKHLGELLEQIRYAVGGYRAATKEFGRGRAAGDTPGIIGEAEYRRMRTLILPLETQYLREVGESIDEPEVTYVRHSDDAYWLPAEEEEEKPRVLLLLDSSPSISEKELALFMNLVKRSLEVYDIEYEVLVFSVGEVDHKVLTLENFDEKRFKVKRGSGTVWDESVAKRIREATERGVRLIQVLSDFYIYIVPPVLEELKRFKALSGRVSCFSVTRKFLDFCDFKHDIKLS